ADPGIHDAPLPYLHSLGARTHRLDHAEGLVSRREGWHAAALLHVETLAAACSAWSMSQRMSSSVSMPTEMRTMSGVTPACSWSASLICRCVVEAGWITRVLASPMV